MSASEPNTSEVVFSRPAHTQDHRCLEQTYIANGDDDRTLQSVDVFVPVFVPVAASIPASDVTLLTLTRGPKCVAAYPSAISLANSRFQVMSFGMLTVHHTDRLTCLALAQSIN